MNFLNDLLLVLSIISIFKSFCNYDWCFAALILLASTLASLSLYALMLGFNCRNVYNYYYCIYPSSCCRSIAALGSLEKYSLVFCLSALFALYGFFSSSFSCGVLSSRGVFEYLFASSKFLFVRMIDLCLVPIGLL